ncbi:MAG: hypothetical protein BMS9Abin17_0253 [Acidimicrobiia bacterium]|nr:MAG: hypothetical protein BMS9Abin17_0253 [Acidimicrobiia bacterium]
MTKRIIGAALLVVASLLAVAILATGRPILPHFIGPILIAAAGVGLLRYRRA